MSDKESSASKSLITNKIKLSPQDRVRYVTNICEALGARPESVALAFIDYACFNKKALPMAMELAVSGTTSFNKNGLYNEEISMFDVWLCKVYLEVHDELRDNPDAFLDTDTDKDKDTIKYSWASRSKLEIVLMYVGTAALAMILANVIAAVLRFLF